MIIDFKNREDLTLEEREQIFKIIGKTNDSIPFICGSFKKEDRDIFDIVKHPFRIPDGGFLKGGGFTLPTYTIEAKVDVQTKLVRGQKWDDVGKEIGKLRRMIDEKIKDDLWHTMLAAAVDRNIVVYDSDDTTGRLSNRLVALMITSVRRNSDEKKKYRLDTIYSSPKSMEFNNHYEDRVESLEKFTNEYQSYLKNELAAKPADNDKEFCLGVTLKKDNLVVVQDGPLVVWAEENPNIFTTYTAKVNIGCGVMDNKTMLLGSF